MSGSWGLNQPRHLKVEGNPKGHPVHRFSNRFIYVVVLVVLCEISKTETK